MCPRLSANYVSCCPPNMAQVSVWAGNLQASDVEVKLCTVLKPNDYNIITVRYYTDTK